MYGSPGRRSTPTGNAATSQSRLSDKEKRWSWLADRRDANGRSPTDPEYDSNTLYIPVKELMALSPTRRQYWMFKRQHMCTVLFFQVGSFFELYEDDAQLGKQLFGMKITERPNMSSVGFPIFAFDEWATKFVARGYQIVKIEQRTEQDEDKIKAMNNTRGGGGNMAENRKVTDVLTSGTLIDPSLLGDDARLLLSFVEGTCPTSSSVSSGAAAAGGGPVARVGFCLLDASVGRFSLGELDDDAQRTKLETVLLQARPQECLMQKKHVSQRSRTLVNRLCGGLGAASDHDRYLQRVHLVDHISADDTARLIDSTGYFPPTDELASQAEETGWPRVLADVRVNEPLALSALGACLSYLRSFEAAYDSEQQKDVDLMRQRNFQRDIFSRMATESSNMLLDAQTLVNLEILENSTDRSQRNTLFGFVNHTVTPFGKRLLRHWICHPLRLIPALNERQAAVAELIASPDLQASIAQHFQSVPDIERLITRVHSRTASLKILLSVVDGVLGLWELIESMQADGRCQLLESSLLRRLLSSRVEDTTANDDDADGNDDRYRASAYFPNLTRVVETVRAIDLAASQQSGKLKVVPGFDSEYDAAADAVSKVQNAFAQRLEQLRRDLRAKSTDMEFKAAGNHKYLVQIKNKFLETSNARNLPSFKQLTLENSNKSTSRFKDEFIEQNLPALEEAEQELERTQANLLLKYIAKVDAHFVRLRDAARCAAELDCLLSLAKASMTLGEHACRPEFVTRPSSRGAFIDVEECRHLLVIPPAGQEVIPNSLAVGGLNAHIFVLTGPNMGGKSTLLRQTCLAFILAQLGCFVPATRCTLSPVDRIFTRVGSSDNLVTGRSTFMVELCETATILQHATPDSLVVFDELGRGTSTWDGYSIAYAVLVHFAKIPAIVLFSTHYHSLCSEEMLQNRTVQFGYMECYVESDDISFLYKLCSGISTDSHAAEVARMAGVPKLVVDRARIRASQSKQQDEHARSRMLQNSHLWSIFTEAWASCSDSPATLASLQLKLKNLHLLSN